MSIDSKPEVPPQPRNPPTWKRRLMRAVLIYVGIPYVAILVVMTACQRLLIYAPTHTERLLVKSSVGSDIEADDVEILASDGLTLHGWLFHADSNTDDFPRRLVLYFPGNAGCRAERVNDCRDFTRFNCDVLLVDYRGYGDNGGSPNETSFASDAIHVWLFATKELHFDAQRIVIFGESLGGAMATRLAAETSLAGTPPVALILNSVFASLAGTVAWHYPAFPFQFLLLDRYPSIHRIKDVTCPILQFHGTADDIVPFSQGRQLFEAAPPKSFSGIEKRFIEIPGGQHNFISMTEMQDAVRRLLSRQL